MPRKFMKYYDGCNIYSYKKCGADLSRLSELISTSFMGASGKAYLLNKSYIL